MVLLTACVLFGAATLLCGVLLQFRLPGWQTVAGLQSFPAAKRENIAIPGLCRGLSLVYYAVAAVFISASVFLGLKSITPDQVLMYLPVVIFTAVDAVWILYRIYDRNDYSPRMRRAAVMLFLSLNVLFICVYLIVFRMQ